MRYSEHNILKAGLSIFQGLINEIVVIGLRKALKHELKDLKGLITVEDVSDLDIELLRILDSPIICFTVKILNHLVEFRHDYKIVNELELLHIEDDDIGLQLGDDIIRNFLWREREVEDPDYWSFLDTARGTIHEVCKLIGTGKTDMYEEGYIDKYWETRFGDLTEMDRSNSTVDFFWNLINLFKDWENEYAELD